MFITKKAFKDLVKAAYKTGSLYVFNDGEGYRIKGGYWDMWIKIKAFPKEYKAVMIELIEDLPGIGTGGNYTKDGIQQEIPEILDLRTLCEHQGPDYSNTGIRFINGRGEELSIMQSNHKSILLPYSHIINGISGAVIDDENGETLPFGPWNPVDNILAWKNNVMSFITFCRMDIAVRNFVCFMQQENLWTLINGEGD